MKSFRRFVLTFLLLIVVSLALLTGVRSIPNEHIKENVESSALLLSQEGENAKALNNPFWKLDNFTNSWMLNITFTSDSTSSFQQTLVNPYWDSDQLSKVEILKELSESSPPAHGVKSNYARYWHGYQLTLKPLLLITDYHGIRIIIIIVELLLIIFVALGCYCRLPRIYLWTFLLTSVVFYFPVCFLSIQFSSCFIISLITVAIILYSEKPVKDPGTINLLLFIVGAVTALFDLLTTPLITLCFPLIIYGGLKRKLSVKRTIQLSVCWGLGYLLFWASKWVLASIFTDCDIISDAIEQIMYRSVGEIKNSDSIIRQIIMPMLTSVLFIGPLFYYFINRKFRENSGMIRGINDNIYLILIAYYPVLWFLLFSNHSVIHIWFTYRIWSVAIFALNLFGYKLLGALRRNYKTQL